MKTTRVTTKAAALDALATLRNATARALASNAADLLKFRRLMRNGPMQAQYNWTCHGLHLAMLDYRALLKALPEADRRALLHDCRQWVRVHREMREHLYRRAA